LETASYLFWLNPVISKIRRDRKFASTLPEISPSSQSIAASSLKPACDHFSAVCTTLKFIFHHTATYTTHTGTLHAVYPTPAPLFARYIIARRPSPLE
jgi:hypothetical protein